MFVLDLTKYLPYTCVYSYGTTNYISFRTFSSSLQTSRTRNNNRNCRKITFVSTSNGNVTSSIILFTWSSLHVLPIINSNNPSIALLYPAVIYVTWKRLQCYVTGHEQSSPLTESVDPTLLYGIKVFEKGNNLEILAQMWVELKLEASFSKQLLGSILVITPLVFSRCTHLGSPPRYENFAFKRQCHFNHSQVRFPSLNKKCETWGITKLPVKRRRAWQPSSRAIPITATSNWPIDDCSDHLYYLCIRARFNGPFYIVKESHDCVHYYEQYICGPTSYCIL